MASQPPPGVRRWLRPALGIALSLIFLALALRGVSLGDVWAALVQANPVYVLLALGASMAVNIVKAVRWRVILQPYAMLPLRRLFAVLMIGQSINTFAPLRVGDVARAYLVEGVATATVLYSVFIEKALDSLTLLALLLVVGVAMPLPAWLKQSGILMSLALVAILLIVLLAGRNGKRLAGAGAWIESVAPALRRLNLAQRVHSAADALGQLSRANVLAAVLAWTILSYALGIAANALLFPAMGLTLADPALAATFLIIVLYLGAVAPSSPGKVGVFHYLCVISLALFGVDKTPALAYAVVLHLVAYGPPALLGAYYFWRESQKRSITLR
jgi:hypothetical protein